MKRPIFFLGAGLIVAVASVIAFRAARQRTAADRIRTVLATKRVELERQQQHWLTELAAAKKERSVGAISGNQPVDVPKAVLAPARAKPDELGPKAADSLQEWLEDPKVQVLHMAFERANLWRSYGPFFFAQRLSPEQIEQLSDLIIATRMHRFDISEINRKQGVPFSDPALKAASERGEAETKAAMVALLGDEVYAKLSDYRRALEIRAAVADMAGIAAVEGTPLSRAQAEALTQAIANTTPTYPLGGSALISKVDWTKAEAAMQQILTADQLKVLRPNGRVRTRSRASSELFQAVKQARREMNAQHKVSGR